MSIYCHHVAESSAFCGFFCCHVAEVSGWKSVTQSVAMVTLGVAIATMKQGQSASSEAF